MLPIRTTRFALLSFIALGLCGLALFMLPSTSPAAPTINWNPATVSEIVAQGETINIPVSFRAGEKLTNVTFRVVPELSPYVSVTPASIASIGKDETVVVTLSFSPAEDAPLGIFDGTIQLRSESKPNKTYAKPLPVQLDIVHPTQLRLQGVSSSSALPGQTVKLAFDGGYPARTLYTSLDGQEIPATWLATGTEETPNIAEFTVPEDAESGPLYLLQGQFTSNALWFDVSEPGPRVPTPDEIVFDELGNPLAVNLLLVSLHEDSFSLAEAQRLAGTVGATVTAALPLVSGYQFHLSTTDLAELQQAAALIEPDPAVDFVVFEHFMPFNNVPSVWSVSSGDGARRSLNRVEEGAALYRDRVDPALGGKHRPTPVKIGVVEHGVDFDDADFDGYFGSPLADLVGGPIASNNITIYAVDVAKAFAEYTGHGTTVVGMIAAELGDDVNDSASGSCVSGCNAGLLQGLNNNHGGFEILVKAITKSNPLDLTLGTWGQLGIIPFIPSAWTEATEDMLEWGADVINWSSSVTLEGQKTCTGAAVSGPNVYTSWQFNNVRRLYEKALQKIGRDYPQTIVVIAAGNDSTSADKDTSVPSGIDSDATIVVGAHTNAGTSGLSNVNNTCTNVTSLSQPIRNRYSNYGAEVDLLAAGDVTNSYGKISTGTSFAAPLVVAVVAAMKSIKPDLTASEVRLLLRKSALPVDPDVIRPQDSVKVGDATEPLSASRGEVRPDGKCYSDPTQECEGKAARLNFEVAIKAVLGELSDSSPVATDDTYSIGEASILNGNVITDDTGNGPDSDADGDTLTAAQVSVDPVNAAAFTFNSDGSFSYRSVPDFNGTDTFTYTISDGKLWSDTATVIVTVTSTSQVWSGTKQFGTISDDQAFAVAADDTGNVFIVGSTFGGMDGYINNGLNDVFVVKYDAAGVQQWTRQFGTARYDSGSGVAADAAGNVYVVGGVEGSLNGNIAVGSEDVYVVKYNAGGIEQWTRQFGTTSLDEGYDVAVDAAGNVYVTGYTYGGLDGNVNAGFRDIYVVKFDATGTMLWAQQLGTVGDEYGAGVAVDADGDVYVAGGTDGGLDGYTSAGSRDAFLVKYSANGIKQWTRQMGTKGKDGFSGVGVDSAGNVYAGGYTYGSMDGKANEGSSDVFLVKYDTAGVTQWTRQIGTPGLDGFGVVAVDTTGEAYLAGGTDGDIDGIANSGPSDMFIVKFDTLGVKQWSQQFGTTADDFAHGITVGVNGDVYAVGYTYGGFDGYTNAGPPDAFVMKYDAAGLKQ